MKAYISVSFSHRKILAAEITAIKDSLQALGIEGVVFVDQYQFTENQSQEMMQRAIRDIDQSDILIAETSDKAIGIGVEVGYAKAKGKPIIYLRNVLAAHSTTVAGISDYQIIYSDSRDLIQQLAICLEQIKAMRNL